MHSREEKKLTVGVFTHDFFPIIGGQGRHVHELYKQNEIYKKVKLLIFSPSFNNYYSHITLFPKTAKNIFRNIDFSVRLIFNIERIIEQYNLDVVHIHGGPGGLFLLKKISKPTIFTAHHTYWQQSHYISSQRWKKAFIPLEKFGYQQANHIICVSQDTLRILEKEYHIRRAFLSYIPNGIDLKKFHKIKKIPLAKEILYVGRLDERKGVTFIVEAMKKINMVDKNIKLHIVGEGKIKKRLKQYTKLNNLNIKFHNFLSDEDLNTLYEHISIQVVPSVFEGFGFTVIEAMAKGIPVIATEVDGIRSIVKNGKNGILVKYGDVEELTNKLVSLLNNTLLRKRISLEASDYVKKYNWKDIYFDTIHLYEKQ